MKTKPKNWKPRERIPDEEFSPQELRLVLHLATGCSKAEAGRREDCSREHVSRLFGEPLFRWAVSQRSIELFQETLRGILDLQTDAVRVLRELLASEDDNVRLKAVALTLKSAADFALSNQKSLFVEQRHEILKEVKSLQKR